MKIQCSGMWYWYNSKILPLHERRIKFYIKIEMWMGSFCVTLDRCESLIRFQQGKNNHCGIGQLLNKLFAV